MIDAKKLLQPLVVGFLVQLLIGSFYRILYTSFPLDLLATLLICLPYFGLALGAFLTRRFRALSAGLEAALLVGTLVFAAAAIANLDVMVHYLLMKLYYPFPRPHHYHARMAALAIGICLSPIPLVPLGARLGREMDDAPRPHPVFAAYAAGSAAGWGAAFAGNLTLGPYALLAVASALTLWLVLPRKALALLGTIVIGSAFWLAENQDEVFFVWRLKGYERFERRWSPYYKLDFLKFQDDSCLGLLYDNLMVSYACEDPAMVPLEVRQIVGAASAGKKRVLVAGRVDGMYLNAIRKEHGPPVRSLSLELDPVMVGAMTGRYARFANSAFDEPGAEARAGDLRQAFAHLDEAFDVVFLTGQMIRLFPMPYTLIPQEDYLFTRDSFRTIFDRLLTPNGVLVVDWGSTKGEVIYDIVSNLPKDVHVRGIWTTLSSYPLAGTPIYFIFASRSEAEVERILWDLQGRGGFTEAKIEREKLYRADTDDRPYLQYGLMPVVLSVSVLPMVALGVITAAAGRRAASAGLAKTEATTQALVAGVVLGAVWTLAVGRFCRVFDGGPAFGAVYAGSALLAGYCLAIEAFPWTRARLESATTAVLLTATGIAVGFAAPSSVLAIVGSFAAGAGAGLIWSRGISAAPAERAGRSTAWGLERLGGIWGLVLSQWAFWALGFLGSAILAALVACLPALLEWRVRARARGSLA